MKKKIFSIIVVIQLCFVCIFNMVSFADGFDTTAPEITGLSFATQNAQAPGSAILNIDFVEEGTGVCYIDVQLFYQDDHSRQINARFGEAADDDSMTLTSGRYSANIDIPPNVLSGEWYIGQITMRDHAGNETTIIGPVPIYDENNEYVKDGYFQNDKVVDFDVPYLNITGGVSDATKPEIVGLSFSSQSVSAGDEVKLNMDYIEEGTGIAGGYVQLHYCGDLGTIENDSNRSINVWFGKDVGDNMSLKTGRYALSINVPTSVLSGKWVVSYISLTDNAGNITIFDRDISVDEKGNYVSEEYYQNGQIVNFALPELHIVGGISDSTRPHITGLSFDKNVVYRPGVVRLTIEFKEEESGVCGGGVQLSHKDSSGSIGENGIISVFFGKGAGEEDLSITNGSYTVDIPVGTNNLTGTWCIDSVNIEDNAGNSNGLYGGRGSDVYYQNDSIVDFEIPGFTVEDEFDVEFEVSLSNMLLVDKLTNMEEGKTARVLIDNASIGIMKKEVFDAIKGKDKTILLYTQDGRQWIFNGKNITEETKDIDLNFSIQNRSASDVGADDNVVEVAFADNGILPGKAQIRMKSDYLYNLYGVKGQLYLYHENGEILQKENNANFDLNFDGTDKWCYFDVYHNSSFIISANNNLKRVNNVSIDYLSSKTQNKDLKFEKTTNRVAKAPKTCDKIMGLF
ncbi:MAG: hypothetical protein E7279_09975 [Lachnospiraceae bacterium]|nr:hypothetical protein [Lachnospiraceae bacterium]